MGTVIDVNTVFGIWPVRKVEISLEMLLSILERGNVSKALSLSARGIFYDYHEGNDETLAVSQQDARIIPVATINPARYFGIVEEVQKRIDQGFRVFRFFPRYQDWHLDYAPFSRVIKALAQTPAILMLPASEGINNVARLSEKIKNPVIIDTLRYFNLAEALVVMQENPRIFVETHLINSANFVELLVQEVGAERVLFGSSTPLNYLSSARMPIEMAEVTLDQKALILGGNILRLLEMANENH